MDSEEKRILLDSLRKGIVAGDIVISEVQEVVDSCDQNGNLTFAGLMVA